MGTDKSWKHFWTFYMVVQAEKDILMLVWNDHVHAVSQFPSQETRFLSLLKKNNNTNKKLKITIIICLKNSNSVGVQTDENETTQRGHEESDLAVGVTWHCDIYLIWHWHSEYPLYTPLSLTLIHSHSHTLPSQPRTPQRVPRGLHTRLSSSTKQATGQKSSTFVSHVNQRRQHFENSLYIPSAWSLDGSEYTICTPWRWHFFPSKFPGT